MKKNAFTLIELLAVIFILGIIAVIIIPTFTATLNRTRERLNDNQKKQIINAARNWGMENLTINENAQDVKYVTIETLQNSGFLEAKEITDLIERKTLTTDTVICIRYKNKQYEYTFEGDKTSSGEVCQKWEKMHLL